MRHGGSKRKKSSSFVRYIFVLCAVGAAIGFLMLNVFMRLEPRELDSSSDQLGNGDKFEENPARRGMEGRRSSCATVEQMGEAFKDGVWKESLRVLQECDIFLLSSFANMVLSWANLQRQALGMRCTRF